MGRLRIKPQRRKHVGFLIQLTDKDGDAFKCLWEALQIVSRPKSVREIRTALAIENKLLALSVDESVEAAIVCPKCKERSPIQHFEHYNWWRLPQTRVLTTPSAFFLEDEAFQYLKQVLGEVQPPQPKVRSFARLWDILEDAEKHWKGDEVELRMKLEPLESLSPRE